MNRRQDLDTIRGLTLLSMMAYHAAWDLVYLFGVRWTWYRSFGAYLWQQSICWTFILLSGYCIHLGRRPLRRGLMAFGGGALVSVVTAVFMPESRIFCGVLTLLGLSTLLTIPLGGLLRRVPARAGAAMSFTLFLLTRDVGDGFLGFEGGHLLALPRALYANSATAVLGFPPANFYSSDYFPLFPWVFLFFTGYFLYDLRRRPPSRAGIPAAAAMGRHSLLLYLLHQLLIYAALEGLHLAGLF